MEATTWKLIDWKELEIAVNWSIKTNMIATVAVVNVNEIYEINGYKGDALLPGGEISVWGTTQGENWRLGVTIVNLPD